jgi:hypothetical protein
MNSLNTKVRVGVLSAGALVLLAVFALNVRNIGVKNAETARLLSEYGEIEKTEEAANTIRSLRASASADIESLESLTLSNDRLVPLIESIEEAGRSLDLNLKITSVEKREESEGSPQTIRIAIEAVGDWGGTFTLPHAIESLPYRVMIENATLAKGEEGWRENIILSLHSFK